MTERLLRIYDPLNENSAEFAHPVKGTDFFRFDILDGTPRSSEWTPVDMEIIREDRGKPLREVDSPWLGSDVLVFRPSVVRALGPLLRSEGELLPLNCETAHLVAFNPTTRLKALDEEHSTISRFDDGRIMIIYKYAFLPDVIGRHKTFKISNADASPTFVTQEFVDAWRQAGLTGLEFTLLWEGPAP